MQQASTFRDPAASLRIEEGRVVRTVIAEAAEEFANLLADPFIQALQTAGRLIGTRPLRSPAAEPGEPVPAKEVRYEHDLVPFATYPVEWSPAMLARAAEFTLELALDLLQHGYLLKDATPANVLFNATTPILVDVPSITARAKGTYIWNALDQFERTFLLPLIANVEIGVPISWSLQDPARGLSHESLYRLLGPGKWLRWSLLRSVTVPALLTRQAADRPHRELRLMPNDDQARFVLARTLNSNLSLIRRLAARIRRESHSMWQGYTSSRQHYAVADISDKHEFIEMALERSRPSWVLDIGANTGEFSRLSASDAEVVAIESDEAAANGIFLRSAQEKRRVLAIVADIARPTPACGWENHETTALIDRLRGRFDLVLLLAVVHHLRATAGIPVRHMFDLLHQITTSRAVVEHVPVSDPMFQRLSKGRDALFGDCDREAFERELCRHFAIEASRKLANGRTLYLARRNPGPTDSG